MVLEWVGGWRNAMVRGLSTMLPDKSQYSPNSIKQNSTRNNYSYFGNIMSILVSDFR